MDGAWLHYEGERLKLSISFPNFTLYRIVCKNLISRLKYKNCFCSCIWSNVKKEKQREIYTSPQVEVVKEIHKMLISDLQNLAND